jgi:hypothetical protein
MNLDHRTSSAERHAHRLRDGILWAVLLLVLAVSVTLEFPGLRGALEQVTNAAPGWLLLAAVLELASCLCYVAIVRLVLPDSPPRQVRWLAWAEMAFAVLVPIGGSGGLAVGGLGDACLGHRMDADREPLRGALSPAQNDAGAKSGRIRSAFRRFVGQTPAGTISL